jgi:hypothetical protein
MEDSEDGRVGVFDCYASVTTSDGRDFCHLVPFRQRWRAENLVARIQVAGVIDTDHWVEMPKAMPLEERFALYAEREQEARWGLRSEDDLYDGIPCR